MWIISLRFYFLKIELKHRNKYGIRTIVQINIRELYKVCCGTREEEENYMIKAVESKGEALSALGTSARSQGNGT